MASLRQFLDEQVYPSLFECLADAFPEFSFKNVSKGYQSTTGQKIDNSAGEKGKVYIYQNNISHFIDYTRGSVSIWDYLKFRDNLSQWETFQLLCSLANVAIPSQLIKDSEIDEIENANSKTRILEAANDFFIEALSGINSDYARTQAAAAVRSYIQDYRKIELHELRILGSDSNGIKLELGYIPSVADLYRHLIENKQFMDTEVYAILKLAPGIGATHQLSIPYRDPSGRIRGFAFRTIQTKANLKPIEPKYLYSNNLKRDDILFNLSAVKGEKDLVIVEGLLDCLVASVRGVENVVAIGGSTLSNKQLLEALRLGARKITLCLDNDKTGEENTLKAIKLIGEEVFLPCYAITLPKGYKDPDELITGAGIDVFKTLINQALPYYIYLLHKTINLFYEKNNQPETNWKAVDSLLEQIIAVGSSIHEAVHRDIFQTEFLKLSEPWGISKSSLEEAIGEIRSSQERDKRKTGLIKLLNDAKDKISKEPTDKVLEFVESKLLHIKRGVSTLNFAKLLEIATEEDVKYKMGRLPDSLKTGYYLTDLFGNADELMLPSGALSVVAARTSHGKTAMLMNLAMNVCLAYPDKVIHFFSLEEDKEAILVKMLNIFINKDLMAGMKNTKYIKNYFKTGGRGFHNRDFIEAKDQFFNELIYSGRLRIHYFSPQVDDLIDAVHYMGERHSIGLVLIDYIQLLTSGSYYQSRQLELQAICNKLLMELAVPSGLPVVLGAQFNREVTEEGMMEATKIREAGDIEQTAHLILALWNRAYTKKMHKDKQGKSAIHNPNEIYLEILKNRDGLSGLYSELDFNGSTGKINNKFDPMQHYM